MDALRWVYLVNFVLLMMHETDAAYWKEWKQFGKFGASLSDKQGLTLFVLARIPICIPVLYGLLHLGQLVGLVISLVFGTFIIGHFIVHMLAKKQGGSEFAWPISYIVQFGLFFLSIIQIYLTVVILKY